MIHHESAHHAHQVRQERDRHAHEERAPLHMPTMPTMYETIMPKNYPHKNENSIQNLPSIHTVCETTMPKNEPSKLAESTDEVEGNGKLEHEEDDKDEYVECYELSLIHI